ncbi:hypothetical protein FSP39_019698, partial [Pinctada imbricata]
CKQCSTSSLLSQTSIKQEISLVLPSMYNPSCRIGVTTQTTPAFSTNVIFPSICPTDVVPETNSEIRCGYYTGRLTAKVADGLGQFTTSTFSMRCFQVITSAQYGCKDIDTLTSDDIIHFQNLLQSKFSSLVTFHGFEGARCYCRNSDCGDVSGAKMLNMGVWSTCLSMLTALVVFLAL